MTLGWRIAPYHYFSTIGLLLPKRIDRFRPFSSTNSLGRCDSHSGAAQRADCLSLEMQHVGILCHGRNIVASSLYVFHDHSVSSGICCISITLQPRSGPSEGVCCSFVTRNSMFGLRSSSPSMLPNQEKGWTVHATAPMRNTEIMLHKKGKVVAKQCVLSLALVTFMMNTTPPTPAKPFRATLGSIVVLENPLQ